MVTSVVPPAMALGHEPVPVEAAMSTPGPAVAATVPGSGHGSVCDSVPPRGNLAGRAAQTAVELVEPNAFGVMVPGVQWTSGVAPRAGPAVLTRLCVSRT
jgi:hypothetical protein